MRRTLWLRVALVGALVASLGIALTRAQGTVKVAPTRTMRWSGAIVDERATVGAIHTYVIALDSGPRVLVALTSEVPLGARAIVRGRLEPLDDTRNPYEPSEASIEAERGISGRIESGRLMTLERGNPTTIAAWMASARGSALAALRDHLSEPGASIVAGELWGDRSALPPDLRAEFSETGTVHVLVTAGLHVGLVALLVLAIAERLSLPRTFSCSAACAAVWILALFSGLALPALRAATMTSVALLARAHGRASISWHTLTIAAIVVLAVFPASFTSASFWLSFCCVASIFACARPLEAALERYHLHERLREALVASIATQLGTWPLTAATFLQFSPYGIIANMAVVPCVPVTMVLGALQLVATPIPLLAQAIANVNAWFLLWMVSVVQLLATAPGASIPMSPAPAWCTAVYEVALVGAMTIAWKRPRIACGTVALAALLVLAPPRANDARLRITVLDVGQADAIVIQTPGGHAILVDAGGRLERGPIGEGSVAESVGERIVVPFLLRSGIHALDALILSHPHGDHAGGCAPVLRKIRVAEIADSGQTYGGHAFHDCLDTAAADHVSIVHTRAGDVWRTNDGTTLTFIGPSLPFIGGKNAINDNSVAFILQYKQFRMLFTGDAGVAAEQRFMNEGVDLHADVLKVGHHGSAYSSSPEFIAAAEPRYAIISVGRHNLFGHPAPSTIETLKRFRAKVCRTDENGAAAITTDGFRTQTSTILAEPRMR